MCGDDTEGTSGDFHGTCMTLGVSDVDCVL